MQQSEFATFTISCLYICSGFLVLNDYEAGPRVSFLVIIAKYFLNPTDSKDADISSQTTLLLKQVAMLAFCALIETEGEITKEQQNVSLLWRSPKAEPVSPPNKVIYSKVPSPSLISEKSRKASPSPQSGSKRSRSPSRKSVASRKSKVSLK